MTLYSAFVVSYWISTSNHNTSSARVPCCPVVSYWNSTSNHNLWNTREGGDISCILLKFYIKPQPRYWQGICRISCILLKFYIKPQLQIKKLYTDRSCILLKFYIKPQLPDIPYKELQVVSYWNSTSNHNAIPVLRLPTPVVSYWNSTSNHNAGPQRVFESFVVSYWNSTSNHNGVATPTAYQVLYLIEILHQTTTLFGTALLLLCCILLKFYIKPQQVRKFGAENRGCILLKFYIKPQRRTSESFWIICCILLKFYIKPQLHADGIGHQPVVSYWNSTSNHNSWAADWPARRVVSYWNSTSNHNTSRSIKCLLSVVSYWNSTSNHNDLLRFRNSVQLYLIEILHQTTT